MKYFSSRSALVVISLTLAGCSVFDPSLYQHPSGGVALADRCESLATVPTVMPGGALPLAVDTTHLADSYREFSGCIGAELPGNDGFFQVEMRRGETWHFHVDLVSPDADPAIYVLPICTTLQCSPAGAEDQCGPGRSEHFSFRPESDGAHVVGIDSRIAGGARYMVTVVRPVCGDGVLQHGEPCDDNRPQAGVTCDRCHKVLFRALDTEAGVANDDYTNAMLLRPTGAFVDFSVVGTLGGCDADMFRFELTAGQALTATLSPRAESSCPTGVTLDLLRTDSPASSTDLETAPVVVNDAQSTAMNGCTSLTLSTASVRAGLYYLRVRSSRDATGDFAYQLTTTVTGP